MTGEEASDVKHLYTREFDEIRDALIGETDADNYRHTIVRSAFMEEFWEDEKVQALVSQWVQVTGLEKRALRLANAGEQLAELAGLDNRGELSRYDELPVAEDKAYAFDAALSEWEDAFDDLMLQIGDSPHAEEIGQQAMDFIRELGLPYPWLVFELVEATLLALRGFALGQVFRQEGWYEPEPLSEIVAPMVTMSFQTREGETVEQAMSRPLDEFERNLEELTEPVPPSGKVPERTIPALERNARWFCRHRVKGESIRSIAMSEFGNSDRRKDVYDGIKRAEELLNLTQFTF